VTLTLEPKNADESQSGQTASLFGDDKLNPHERKILAVLKADEGHATRRNDRMPGAAIVVF
jgi:hypothetical protein